MRWWRWRTLCTINAKYADHACNPSTDSYADVEPIEGQLRQIINDHMVVHEFHVLHCIGCMVGCSSYFWIGTTNTNGIGCEHLHLDLYWCRWHRKSVRSIDSSDSGSEIVVPECKKYQHTGRSYTYWDWLCLKRVHYLGRSVW